MMFEKLVEAATIFGIIAGLSYLVGMAISQSLESAIRDRQMAKGADGRLQRYILMAQRMAQRRDGLLPQLARLEGELKSAKRRLYMANKKLADLKVARNQLMRALGEEDAFQRQERPSRKFIAHIINRHVQRAQFDQKEHPFLSRGWSRTQQAVIWAPTVGDAKMLAEKAFPPATGFFIAEISEPQSDGDDMSLLEKAEVKAAMSEQGGRAS
jgi:hypothetical protein